jgi:mRNA interferase MazF
VVLVPFDFTDRSGTKWRPAAVVSGRRYNSGPDVVIASITGNLAAIAHPGDHRIRDWQAAGLLRPSLLQTKLATVETSVLGKRLGQLSADDLAAFDKGLREALDL